MSYVLKNKILGDKSNTLYKYINSYLDQHKKEKDIKRKIINREFLKCCNIAIEAVEAPGDLMWDTFILDLIWEILYYRFHRFKGRRRAGRCYMYPRAWRASTVLLRY